MAAIFSFFACAFAQEAKQAPAKKRAGEGAGEFVYNPKGKRDPFIPLVTRNGRLLQLDYQEEGVITPVVEGIVYDKRGISYAIVNGEIVMVGDKIYNFKVLKIEDNKVILLNEGQLVEIILQREDEE